MATILAGLQPNSTVPQVVDHIWVWVSNQINSGQVNNIRLPFNFKRLIGQDGFKTLTDRFQEIIQAPVSCIEEPAAGVIRMMPTHSSKGRVTSDNAPEPKSVAGKTDKVKRPANAFILYRKHYHPLIKDENPGIHNNEISIILGKQWKGETHKVQAHYKSMAEAIKKKHLEENPEYAYQPRKSADKKRRMTKKKAAALAKIAGALSSVPTTSSTETSKASSVSVSASSKGLELTSSNSQSTGSGNDLLELEKTNAGNITLVLGDEIIDDNQLLDLLTSYNKSLPSPLPTTMVRASRTPAIIYTALDGEVQDENNFFDSQIDFERLWNENAALIQYHQDLFDADTHPVDDMNELQRTKLWDFQHGFRP